MFVYRQQDLILVPFPFTDGSTSKKRPVVVISNNTINGDGSHEDFVAVAVTSKIRNTPYSLKFDNSDLSDGALPEKESEIRCDKLATLQKDLAIKRFGRINDTTFALLKSKIVDEVIH